jgi:hypothetical protein
MKTFTIEAKLNQPMSRRLLPSPAQLNREKIHIEALHMAVCDLRKAMLHPLDGMGIEDSVTRERLVTAREGLYLAGSYLKKLHRRLKHDFQQAGLRWESGIARRTDE